VFAAGLFNFSLFYLAVIGAGFQYLQPWFERRIPDPDRWARRDIGRIDADVSQFAHLGLFISAALVLLVLLLGVITGVLRTVARDYRFRLSRAPSGFRRRRGLFTLSEVVIPLRRVQLAILGSGLIRQRLGWHDLQFQTLSAEAQQSGHQAAAPFARIEEIMPILAEAGIADLPRQEEYIRVSRRAVLRRYLSHILPFAIVALAVSVFLPIALIGLVPLGLGAAMVVLQWRRHRYVLREKALYISEGILSQRLWILPYDKLQTISVTRSPLQRRFGLATVSIDTAGASILRSPQVRDVLSGDAQALAERLLAEYRQARLAARTPAGERL
jgi:putative membrane protein